MKRIAVCLFALILLLTGCSGALAPETETKEALTAGTATAEKSAEPAETKPEDPADDGILRVLMIGNSFCYHYTDELYGMLKAAGIQSEICNVYYSGCYLSQHWNWYLDNAGNYDFITTGKNGRVEKKDARLVECLKARNWDVITLQQHFGPKVTPDYDTALESCTPYAEKLVNMIRKNYPLADFYWHETWAYQVGYDRFGYQIATLEAQTSQYDILHAVSQKLCADLKMPMIPSGDAWQIARKDPRIGDTLCNRLKDGGDCYHDGDIGGGQYLITCVWFEILTGQSCLENSFRPTGYSIPEEKISALKEAAHAAVEALSD